MLSIVFSSLIIHEFYNKYYNRLNTCFDLYLSLCLYHMTSGPKHITKHYITRHPQSTLLDYSKNFLLNIMKSYEVQKNLPSVLYFILVFFLLSPSVEPGKEPFVFKCNSLDGGSINWYLDTESFYSMSQVMYDGAMIALRCDLHIFLWGADRMPYIFL
jgi:succinate dehydrogenase hydrophobic anchor subunit